MLKKESCAECGDRIGSGDIRDGIAREIKGQLYCRKCILDLGLIVRRGGETEAFLDGVKGVLGDVELTPQETVQVERKARRQAAVMLESILDTIDDHPSWDRADIIQHIKGLI